VLRDCGHSRVSRALLHTLHSNINRVPARGAHPPHRIVVEPRLDVKPDEPEQQLHLARIVDVTIEVADVPIHAAAVGELVIQEPTLRALLVGQVSGCPVGYRLRTPKVKSPEGMLALA
jgi:hypothetical protein